MTNRQISINGKNSLRDFGLRIDSERSTGGTYAQRYSLETIAHRNGALTELAGLEPTQLDYCFIVRGSDRADCESRMQTIQSWLTGFKGELIDSDYMGKKYINVIMTDKPDIEWVSRNFTSAYFTVHFLADPIMQDIGTVNNQIIKFAATGAATLTITDNSSYTLTRGGTTTTGTYTAAEPYTYRLTAYAEGAHTITLSGAEIQPEEPFTMPSNAEIAISGNGYGYYELWHDTREVRV